MEPGLVGCSGTVVRRDILCVRITGGHITMIILERLSSTIFIGSFKLRDGVGMTHTSTAKPAYSIFMAVPTASLDTIFGSV